MQEIKIDKKGFYFKIGVYIVSFILLALVLSGRFDKYLINYISKFNRNDVDKNQFLFLKGFKVIISILFSISIIMLKWGKYIFKTLEFYIEKYKNKRMIIPVIIGIIAYFIFFSLVCINKFYLLDYHLVDLGIQNQIIWNSSFGRLFINTCSETTNFLGAHIALNLLFVVPFYWFFHSPITLLIFQSAILSLGAFPLYLLARILLKNNVIASLFSFLYLLSVPLHGANLFEFHEEIFAPVFLLFSFYFIEKDNSIGTIISLVFVIITKENLGPITSFIGLYLIFYKKKYYLGGVIFLLSIIYTLTALNLILPYFGNGKLALGVVYHTIGLDKGILEAISKVIKHPVEIIDFVFTPKKITYVFMQFGLLLFLPVFSKGRQFILIPGFLIILLSDQSGMSSIYTQNICSVTPILFYLSIYGYITLQKKLSGIKFVNGFLLFFLVFFSFLYSFQLDFLKNYKYYTFENPSAADKKIYKIASQIPFNASVMASNKLGAIVSGRKLFYRVPQYNLPNYNSIFKIPSEDSVEFIIYNVTDVDSIFIRHINKLVFNGKIENIYSDNENFIYKNNHIKN